eukprot:scaffold1484_cov173-Amphora_coffeaeformis.AAC.9
MEYYLSLGMPSCIEKMNESFVWWVQLAYQYDNTRKASMALVWLAMRWTISFSFRSGHRSFACNTTMGHIAYESPSFGLDTVLFPPKIKKWECQRT